MDQAQEDRLRAGLENLLKGTHGADHVAAVSQLLYGTDTPPPGSALDTYLALRAWMRAPRGE